MSKITDWFKLRGQTLTSTKVLVGDTSNIAQEVATTGTGSAVLATGPTLSAPVLGTPASGNLSNCTALPVGSVTGLGTGVGTALAVNVGSAGAPVVNGGALGTPSSGTLTSCTAFTLTTTGTSGASTYSAGTLNVPQYTGGGAASDMLSVLTAAEIAVTGAVTATIGRMHLCTGTSADYTVTLPAASGNTGKFIGFRMGTTSTLTKLVTLDGNASEPIDTALTRVMWAGEACILECDGSGWFKVAGKSLPMVCVMYLSADTANSVNGAITTVPLNTTQTDNTGLMANTGANKMTIRRTGTYQAGFSFVMGIALIADNCQGLVYNGSTIVSAAIFAKETAASGFCSIGASRSLAATSGDDFFLKYIQNATGSSTAPVISGGLSYTMMSLTEVVTW